MTIRKKNLLILVYMRLYRQYLNETNPGKEYILLRRVLLYGYALDVAMGRVRPVLGSG